MVGGKLHESKMRLFPAQHQNTEAACSPELLFLFSLASSVVSFVFAFLCSIRLEPTILGAASKAHQCQTLKEGSGISVCRSYQPGNAPLSEWHSLCGYFFDWFINLQHKLCVLRHVQTPDVKWHFPQPSGSTVQSMEWICCVAQCFWVVLHQD